MNKPAKSLNVSNARTVGMAQSPTSLPRLSPESVQCAIAAARRRKTYEPPRSQR